MKKSATTGKAKAAQIPSEISKPIAASATRAFSPVYGTPRGDLAAPSPILPDIDKGSGEADEGHPREGSARAQKEVKKRGGISGEDKTPKSVSTKALLTPWESPVMQPLRKPSRKQHNKRGYRSDSSSSDEGDNGDAYDPPQPHRNKKKQGVKASQVQGLPQKRKLKPRKRPPLRVYPPEP